jgi:hypothetical protein
VPNTPLPRVLCLYIVSSFSCIHSWASSSSSMGSMALSTTARHPVLRQTRTPLQVVRRRVVAEWPWFPVCFLLCQPLILFPNASSLCVSFDSLAANIIVADKPGKQLMAHDVEYVRRLRGGLLLFPSSHVPAFCLPCCHMTTSTASYSVLFISPCR